MRRLIAIAITTLVLSGSAVQAQPVNFKPIDLGKLDGGTWTEAWHINSRGDVVGFGDDKNSKTRPFFIPTRGPNAFKMIDLGTLGGECPPDQWDCAMAMGINNEGMVVGHARTGSGDVHAWAWSPSTGLKDLGTLPGYLASAAVGVSNTGTVVGSSSDTYNCSQGRAVAWVPKPGASTLQPVALPEGALAALPCWQAWESNETGQIIGHAYDPAIWEPVPLLWNPAKNETGWTVLKLDTPERYPMATTFDINNRGEIVGVAFKRDWSAAVGVVWKPDVPDRSHYAPPIVLKSLADPENTWAGARGINNAGEIVGWSNDASLTDQVVLWRTPESTPVQVGLPGVGYKINGGGEVAAGGNVERSPGSLEYHAFLIRTR